MASLHVNENPAIRLRIYRLLALLGSLAAITFGLVAIFMSAA